MPGLMLQDGRLLQKRTERWKVPRRDHDVLFYRARVRSVGL